MPGMTDRDHFAAAALAGMLSRNNFVGERDQCRAAYLWADAMLRERANHSPDAGKMGQSSGGTYRAWVAQNAALVNAAKEKSAPRTPQADRLAEWERHGSDRWGLGVASDLYDLECRVAALEKANHDAAPAARADPPDERPPHAVSASGGTPSAASRDGGTGDTQKPVAWAAIRENGRALWLSYDRSGAEGMVNGMAEVVPLYRQPTLTDAEREAVDKMRVHLYEISRDNAFIDEVCDDAKAACEAIAAFLERHK